MAMNIFKRVVSKIQLRFYPTANLVAAYELICRAEERNKEILIDMPILEGKVLIYAELVRRGDHELVD
jgi:hypothetical protein